MIFFRIFICLFICITVPSIAFPKKPLEISTQVDFCGPNDFEEDSQSMVVTEHTTGMAVIFEDSTFKVKADSPPKSFSISHTPASESSGIKRPRAFFHGVVGQYSNFVDMKSASGASYSPKGAFDAGELVMSFNENPATPIWAKHFWMDVNYSIFNVYPGDRVETSIEIIPVWRNYEKDVNRFSLKWALVKLNGNVIKRKLVMPESECRGYGIRAWLKDEQTTSP